MNEGDAFIAIADANRRHLLEELRRGEKTVTQLAAGLPVSRPAVSPFCSTRGWSARAPREPSASTR